MVLKVQQRLPVIDIDLYNDCVMRKQRHRSKPAPIDLATMVRDTATSAHTMPSVSVLHCDPPY